jgi:hypothetical protein
VLVIQVEVEVMSKNALGFTTHIGSGKAKLSALVPRTSQSIGIVVDLVHHGKKGDVKQGRMTADAVLVVQTAPIAAAMTAGVAPSVPVVEGITAATKPAESVVPSPNRSMKLKLTKLHVEGLFDTGSMFDKQDPCLQIKVGSHVLGPTARQVDAGTEASFSETFELDLSETEYGNWEVSE